MYLVMEQIDVPYNWEDKTTKDHPESSTLVNSIARFTHTSGAEVVIWKGSKAELSGDNRYQVELRDSDGTIIDLKGFSVGSKNSVYSYAQAQMEMYPVQEVLVGGENKNIRI